MGHVRLLAALLLIIFAAAAGAQGWKWGSLHHSRQIAGWTWDDSAQMFVDDGNGDAA